MFTQYTRPLRSLGGSIIVAILVAGLSGTASALFLRGLEWATATQNRMPWLLWLLPAGGLVVGWVYDRFGRTARKGNNLIIETVNQQTEEEVPLRMAPMVLGGTIITHLFGGSAGREGTAVQMGGSLAAQIGRVLRLSPDQRRIALMSGISAGFGSIFGTPVAGTIFGLEVVRAGAIRYEALLACLVASFIGDRVTAAWGITHAHYQVHLIPDLDAVLAGKVLLAAVAFGVTALCFARFTHLVKEGMARLFRWAPLQPVVGGLLLILLTLLIGTRDYLGLGLPMIARAVSDLPVPPLAFLFKLIFTGITVGSGFPGGEVTPLFFIGSTLGASLAGWLSVPSAFLAALGFVAVFGAAANTPLACLIMGIELFGGGPLIGPLAIACFVAYFVSGRTGIYSSQPVEVQKL